MSFDIHDFTSISSAPTLPLEAWAPGAGAAMKQVPGASAEGGGRGTGHYITGQESPIQQQSLCGGGERQEDEGGGRGGEDLGALCKCSQQVQRLVQVWRKSGGAPRGLLA